MQQIYLTRITSTIVALLLFSCRPSNIQGKYEEAYNLVNNAFSPNWLQANSLLKDLLPYNKEDDNFLAFYAISEMKLGHDNIAEKYIKKALKLKPKNSLYHYFLADLFYQKGELNDTLTHLKICLNLDPNNENAFILLVKTEYKIYSYKIKDFFNESESIKKLNSEKYKKLPQTLYILAAKHYNHNEMTKAFLLLKQAEKIAPKKPETLLNLAVICDIRQIKTLAKKYYSQYLKKTDRNKKYLSTRTQVKKRLKQI